jgi:hypothetical protein
MAIPIKPHLIHDFRNLVQITPSDYRPHSLRRSNHVPRTAREYCREQSLIHSDTSGSSEKFSNDAPEMLR